MNARGFFLVNSGDSVGGNDNTTRLAPARVFEIHHILSKLERRKEKGLLRQLKKLHSVDDESSRNINTIDFSSNDYLGLARSTQQQQKVEDLYKSIPNRYIGSTGSRLLTGDSKYAQDLELKLAKWHKRASAVLCNSGYDANLSVVSCLSLNSMVIMDELCHNSIQMGLRLSRGYKLRKFRHSSLHDLHRVLTVEHQKKPMESAKPAIIFVESIYSMDGDAAPLKEILDMALAYNACVVVDEAHGLGVLGDNGLGLLEKDGLENHPALLCSIHTFGKAAGCHGAVVCGSPVMKEFLLNYGRGIVYSTALPLHSLVSIASSYESMTGITGKELRLKLRDRVQLFRKLFFEKIIGSNSAVMSSLPIRLVASVSPIMALIIPGNNACLQFCEKIWKKSRNSICLYPIRSPTVPRGQERVRIIIHSHNTENEVNYLIELIRSTLSDMNIIPEKSTSGSCQNSLDTADILSSRL